MKTFLLLILTLLLLSSCQKEIEERSLESKEVEIPLVNPGFEQDLNGWTVTNPEGYRGIYGFSTTAAAARSGTYGLNFYVSQTTHYSGAPQETPWTGSILQTVHGLLNGNYVYRIFADAVGEGMYVYADGGAGEKLIPILSGKSEQQEIYFSVRGGTVTIGFKCIDAGGTEPLAPYFHADNATLFYLPS